MSTRTPRENDDTVLGVADVEAALQLASRAPSIHNTQPWGWVFDGTTLSLRADRSRQLTVADPDGHSLLISCGAALTATVDALKARGWAVTTERMPDPGDPDLLARFTNPRRVTVDDIDRVRAEAAGRRFSDRRPFAAQQVTEAISEQLRAAADGEQVHTHFPTREDEKTDLAVAVSWADRVERDDPEYMAEMARWLRDEEVHADGVPLSAVPKVDPGHPRHVDVPVRDFQAGMSGRQLIEQDVDEHPLIAVLLSDADNPLAHLSAGEAMMRLMIQAEILGVGCCPLSQAVDLVAFRTRVQTVMGWVGNPQMMLRLGYPASPTDEVPKTPRRAVDSMLRVITFD